MNTKKHLQFCKCFFCCIPEGARTLDPLIKSQLLYQLSYGNNFLSCCKSTLFFCYTKFIHLIFIKNAKIDFSLKKINGV